MSRFDALVLGGGMVGLGTALALQARGRTVALVDRRDPAEETSFGNAGLIQAEAVYPYAFPRNLRVIVETLLDRRTDARVHLRTLPKTARFLLAYAAHSTPGAIDRTARANAPLLAHVVADHRALAEAADVLDLWREGGYLRVYRTAAALDADLEEAAWIDATYGVPFEPLSAAELHALEPHLSHTLAGAIRHAAPARVLDPGALGKAYAALFTARGGTILTGDATTLTRTDGAFQLNTEAGSVSAPECVIALGPWSGAFVKRFGVSIPFGIKRGYHMHYAPKGNEVLNNLFVDIERGYVLGPNVRGVRLTTGAEFSTLEAPDTPVQVGRAEADAGEIFPLGERQDATPWRGARPCLPDLLPMIGPIRSVPGLWANFGHQHLGLTLGPTTGRLLAEMIDGVAPFTDPAPYRVDRF